MHGSTPAFYGHVLHEPHLNTLRVKYRQRDFPHWITYFPFEPEWQVDDLVGSLRRLLSETEEVLVKARAAGLTLDGHDAEHYPTFTLRDWLPWLLEGKREMHLNEVKRTYLKHMQTLREPPGANVKIKTQVLHPKVLAFLVQEIHALCPTTSLGV